MTQYTRKKRQYKFTQRIEDKRKEGKQKGSKLFKKKVKLDYASAPWCKELTHWKRPWCWERLKAGGKGDDRGWDGWMASPTQWTWVWVSSGSWWWTGKPGMLQSMGSQRVGNDWATELNKVDIFMFEESHKLEDEIQKQLSSLKFCE